MGCWYVEGNDGSTLTLGVELENGILRAYFPSLDCLKWPAHTSKGSNLWNLVSGVLTEKFCQTVVTPLEERKKLDL